MARVLADLTGPERACLELAWQALIAGTIPVGAVVADADDEIIASGRNAVFGAAGPSLLSGSLLAHAEVNALIGLPVTRRYTDCRLVTSLEPCQLCTGAVRMATVGALTYLGADPVNGTAWVLESARYVGHRPVAVTGPRPDPVGRLGAAMAVAYHLRQRPAGLYLARYSAVQPGMLTVAAALIDAGLFEMAGDREQWQAAAPVLLAAAGGAAA